MGGQPKCEFPPCHARVNTSKHPSLCMTHADMLVFFVWLTAQAQPKERKDGLIIPGA